MATDAEKVGGRSTSAVAIRQIGQVLQYLSRTQVLTYKSNIQVLILLYLFGRLRSRHRRVPANLLHLLVGPEGANAADGSNCIRQLPGERNITGVKRGPVVGQ